jgi:transcriptional regulator with XRE-family HTH domain
MALSTGPEPDPRRAPQIRAYGRSLGWPPARIAAEISAETGCSLLAGHRLARGWTLRETVRRLAADRPAGEGRTPSVTEQMLCAWERGRAVPTVASLDALCRLHRTRPDLLGFGRDYSDSANSADSAGAAALPRSAGSTAFAGSAAFPAPAGFTCSADGPDLEAVRRRTERALHLVDEAPAELHRLEESVATFVRAHPVTSVAVHLPEVAGHLEAVSWVLDLPGLSPGLRRRGWRVLARLATMTGTGLVHLTAVTEAEPWFTLGRRAAERAGDPALASWVVMFAAMFPATCGSAGQGLRLAATAERLSEARTGPVPTWTADLRACALARLDSPEAALRALRQTQERYCRGSAEGRTDCMTGYDERYLHWLEGRVHAFAGRPRTAWPALERALALLPPEDRLGRAGIAADQAMCLTRSGDQAGAGEFLGTYLATLGTADLHTAGQLAVLLFRAGLREPEGDSATVRELAQAVGLPAG